MKFLDRLSQIFGGLTVFPHLVYGNFWTLVPLWQVCPMGILRNSFACVCLLLFLVCRSCVTLKENHNFINNMTYPGNNKFFLNSLFIVSFYCTHNLLGIDHIAVFQILWITWSIFHLITYLDVHGVFRYLLWGIGTGNIPNTSTSK